MVLNMRSVLAGLCAATLGVTSLLAADQPKPADVEKMEAALPTAAPVVPAKPRKLLIFTLTRGFHHSSIPLSTLALQEMGKKTGAYTATASDDPAVFESASLNEFDAVLMNSTTGELFSPDGKTAKTLTPEQQAAAAAQETRLKASLVEFVHGGKGLAGIHAATDCFYKWPAYTAMIGGLFGGHPWHSNDTVGIKIDDPASPVAAAFDGKNFTITDEIYQFRIPFVRENLHILLSIDPAHTDMTKKGIVKRPEGEFAVSWIKNEGAGRVFYCSIGHREDIYYNATMLKYYLAGIQFAMGDLKADATPSPLPAGHVAEVAEPKK